MNYLSVMNRKMVKIGSRGSRLALYQAERVQEKIADLAPEVDTEIEVIKTKGDKILDVALSKIGDKGLFTKELEKALASGEIDMAVHSLKDLPTALPSGFAVGAVLERGDFRDALVSLNSRKLHELNSSDRVGTSSLRRKAGLLHLNSKPQIVDIRGNVQTRLRKMEEGLCEATVMAVAGLQRIGLEDYITEILPPDLFIPAVSQGIIAVETRINDPYIQTLCDKISHPSTLLAARAERAFLNTLEGGCQIPAGCYTETGESTFSITGFVSSPDGQLYVRDRLSGHPAEAEALARQLATKLLMEGGDAILEQIRGE